MSSVERRSKFLQNGQTKITVLPILLSILLVNPAGALFGQILHESDSCVEIPSKGACFCQLSGRIDGCTCNIDTVDHFNNVKIYPRLRSLLLKDYFRFFKVNLKNQCPFWTDDSKCAMRYCHVQACQDDDIPKGIKDESRKQPDNKGDRGTQQYSKITADQECDQGRLRKLQSEAGKCSRAVSRHDINDREDAGKYCSTLNEECSQERPNKPVKCSSAVNQEESVKMGPENRAEKYSKPNNLVDTNGRGAAGDHQSRSENLECGHKAPNENCDDHKTSLDYLNKTLSVQTQLELEDWTEHDLASQDNFCAFDDQDEGSEYVDLLLNPERYTGYKGPSANRIWNSIYLENCFRPAKANYHSYIQTNRLQDMCLEQRAYYRAISGLHASINIHLSANYLLSKTASGLSLTSPQGEWGPNLEEFRRRFSPETTNGEGPNWLRNLYFVYLLELRALAKVSDDLLKEEFYTGNEAEDWDTQMAIKDLLTTIKDFPHHFDETSMFKGSDQAAKLKREFKEHFRNVTRIMDCVGCDKCKLWGKLQTKGLGTALKILFSDDQFFEAGKNRKVLQLQREEIVALFNAFGRLSTSIYKLDDFRQMMTD